MNDGRKLNKCPEIESSGKRYGVGEIRRTENINRKHFSCYDYQMDIFRHNCYDIITLIWHVINKVIDNDMDDVLVFLFSKRAQNIRKSLEKTGIRIRYYLDKSTVINHHFSFSVLLLPFSSTQ